MVELRRCYLYGCDKYDVTHLGVRETVCQAENYRYSIVVEVCQ